MGFEEAVCITSKPASESGKGEDYVNIPTRNSSLFRNRGKLPTLVEERGGH